ncbi:MAG: ABC transporter permease [Pseudooceanicola sp.]|nr:ABC transporter permease [Pseudooceanicola sp.]
MSAALDTLARDIARQRGRRSARRLRLGLLVGALLLGVVALTLSVGHTITPPGQVLRALAGDDLPGVSFAVRELRLPRAVLSILAGLSFGLGGVAFQIMLRNPLASPDIIGISIGASAAAVLAITAFGLTGMAVSLLAMLSGLGVAVAIYLLSFRNGVAGARLILVGIAIAAMLQSVIAYALARAPSWTLQDALRWLTGSVNGATLSQALQLLASLAVFGALLLAYRRDLETMRLGDDTAAALGVSLTRARAAIMLGAVGMIAVATAVTGPIAFTAFLSGPIAMRLAGPGRSPVLMAGLVGAALVLVGDFIGQQVLPARYPVGIVTGALGAPFLVYLIVRANRTGAL